MKTRWETVINDWNVEIRLRTVPVWPGTPYAISYTMSLHEVPMLKDKRFTMRIKSMLKERLRHEAIQV